MKSIRYVEIWVEARAGAVLHSCLDEGMILCIQNQADVKVTHNTRDYLISYARLTDCIKGPAL